MLSVNADYYIVELTSSEAQISGARVDAAACGEILEVVLKRLLGIARGAGGAAVSGRALIRNFPWSQ